MPKPNIDSVVHIETHASWEVENKYTLNINTPKFMGYRLAQLSAESGAPLLIYATSVNNHGDWIFKGIENKKSLFSLNSRIAEPLDKP